MKEVQISDGIVPLGEFKAQAAKLLKRIGESGQPMVITQNGRPTGVLMSPQEYDRMQERQRFLESIAAGLADAESGRTMTTVELRERLQAWRNDRVGDVRGALRWYPVKLFGFGVAYNRTRIDVDIELDGGIVSLDYSLEGPSVFVTFLVGGLK